MEVFDRLDLLLKVLNVCYCLGLRARHLLVAEPVEGIPGASVFLEDVEHADLSLVSHLPIY